MEKVCGPLYTKQQAKIFKGLNGDLRVWKQKVEKYLARILSLVKTPFRDAGALDKEKEN